MQKHFGKSWNLFAASGPAILTLISRLSASILQKLLKKIVHFREFNTKNYPGNIRAAATRACPKQPICLSTNLADCFLGKCAAPSWHININVQEGKVRKPWSSGNPDHAGGYKRRHAIFKNLVPVATEASPFPTRPPTTNPANFRPKPRDPNIHIPYYKDFQKTKNSQNFNPNFNI